MSTELLINVTPQETRVAVIENGVVQEILIERANRRGLVGNVYKGRVCRVLPGMQAAFVEIGLARAAFLHASDVTAPGAPRDRPPARRNTDRPARHADPGDPSARLGAGDLSARPGAGDLSARPGAGDPDRPDAGDAADTVSRAEPGASRAVPDITALLHEGQELLVQVIKDPLGTKGARLTTHLSIPARYLVLMPGAQSVGVSQKIEDEAERARLRDLVREYTRRHGEAASACGAGAPADGYIVRTAAESASDELLARDMEFLDRLWRDMRERARDARAPVVVHEDLALALRTLRELSGTDLERIRIDSRETFARAIEFTRHYIPEITARIEHYGEADERPIFELHGVEGEIQKALSRKVQLKSGGHLVIDQTEAMTTIDVNTGAYVGFRNLEETTFKTNLEATQAVARQLRLRNLGGIIIIDFIDMLSDEHRRQVLRALEKSLARDPTKTHISNVSALGLVQMTRKRTRESLEHLLCEPCPTCSGRGTIKSADTVCYEIFREILREARQFDAQRLLVLASPEVIDTLVDEESAGFAELEAFIGKPITLQAETQYFREQFDVVLM